MGLRLFGGAANLQVYALQHLGHSYTGARGYHPLLAIAAGTGEVLMSRLGEGRANTVNGAEILGHWGGVIVYH